MIRNFGKPAVKAHKGELTDDQIKRVAAVGSFVLVEGGTLLRST